MVAKRSPGGAAPARRSAAVVTLACVLALVACGPRFPDLGSPLAEPSFSSQPTAPAVSSPVPEGSFKPGTAGTTISRVLKGSGAVVRGGTVYVGGLFPLSGGLSTLGVEAYRGAQAYFNYVNDHGGVRGKRIQFMTCDDQADDTRSTTCAKRLVEQQGAFIMGPSFTPFSFTVVGQLERAGVPWVGYDGINVEGFRASNVVTVGAPIETMAHALLPWWYDQVAKDTGSPPKKLGVVVLQVAPAQTYVREAIDVICPKLGCTIDERNDVRPVNYTTTEYSTICRAMQNRGVDAVWIVTDPASAIKLLVGCQSIGYKPPKGFLGQHGIYLDLTLQQAGRFAEGIYANGAVQPESVNNAASAEMKSIIRTYYPKASFGYFTQLAYSSARMVTDLIERVLANGQELNRTNILAAARATTAYNCHGLCANVNLSPPAGRTGGNHNVWIVRADFSTGKGRWVSVAGPMDAFRSRTWPCPGRPRPC
jgi:branched-chain amino acid transport system substrate-binding protein